MFQVCKFALFFDETCPRCTITMSTASSPSDAEASDATWRRWLLRHSSVVREEHADQPQQLKADIEWPVARGELRDALYALSSAPATSVFSADTISLHALLHVDGTGSVGGAPLFSPALSAAALEELAELCDFWDMPTAWARASRMEIEARCCITDGPLLAPLKSALLQRVLGFVDENMPASCAWKEDSEAVLWSKLQFCLTPRGAALPLNLALVQIFAHLGDMEGLQWAFARDQARERARRARLLKDKNNKTKSNKCRKGACDDDADAEASALMQRLSEQGCPWDAPGAPRQTASELGARLGAGHILEGACSVPHRMDWFKESCNAAVVGGQLPTLQWLYSQGCRLDGRDLESAAQEGHVHVLEWLVQNVTCYECDGYSATDEELCGIAALHGQLPILQWALEGGMVFADPTLCSSAAWHGHMTVLHWLREQGCPWDEDVYELAAMGGQLAVLQWVKAQDPPCPWSEAACSTAAGGGHLEVLQWLRAQDPPCPWHPEKMCVDAVNSKQLPLLQWVVAQGCPWDAHCSALAARPECAHILRWAQEQGLVG